MSDRKLTGHSNADKMNKLMAHCCYKKSLHMIQSKANRTKIVLINEEKCEEKCQCVVIEDFAGT